MTLLIREHTSSSYAPRTWANATEADLTIAIAVDYTTAGEKLTKKAAGDKYLQLDPNHHYKDNARKLWRALAGKTLPTINVAGNGIYTFNKSGKWPQCEINAYVFLILGLVNDHLPLGKVVSGGQTGTDLAGGYAGWKLGIPTVMTLPKGFIMRHEDGEDREHAMEEVWKMCTGEDYVRS